MTDTYRQIEIFRRKGMKALSEDEFTRIINILGFKVNLEESVCDLAYDAKNHNYYRRFNTSVTRDYSIGIISDLQNIVTAINTIIMESVITGDKGIWDVTVQDLIYR